MTKMIYRITYRDREGEIHIKTEETPETKEQLLAHAHVVSVEEVKVIKEPVKRGRPKKVKK